MKHPHTITWSSDVLMCITVTAITANYYNIFNSSNEKHAYLL